MTRLLAALRSPVLRSPWTLLGAVVVLGLVLTCRLNRGRDAEAELRRRVEADVLKARGQLVAEQVRGDALDKLVRQIVGENEELARALEQARRAAPGARPVATARTSTGAVVAGGTPRAPEERGPAAAPPCLLAPGDQGEVRVDQVVLETRAGNRLLVGTAAAWRMSPAPATRLFGGPFQAALSNIAMEAPPQVAGPRWGAGVWLGVGRDGWAAGPALALPQARLGPLSLEAVIGAGLGPTGTWQGGATGIARW